MKRRKRSLYRMVSIELTPLVDVIFILLIFFIFSYNQVRITGHNVSLPDSKSGENLKLDKNKTLNITILNDGNISIEKERVNLKNLSLVIKRKLPKTTDIVITAASSTPIQSLISVMDEIKKAGYNKNPYVKTIKKKGIN